MKHFTVIISRPNRTQKRLIFNCEDESIVNRYLMLTENLVNCKVKIKVADVQKKN